MISVGKAICHKWVKVNVPDLPPFGIELLTRLTIRSFCYMSICGLTYFSFWFRGKELGSDCTSKKYTKIRN